MNLTLFNRAPNTTRGGVQQAKHLYGYDRSGRIANWEKQSLGESSAKDGFGYNLKDELVQAEETNLADGSLTDRETWGLDSAGNWLSHTRTATNLMETRAHDALNRLLRIGGSGSTVVEGTVNEFSSVVVNGQPAQLRADPAGGGYRFRRTVPVQEGANTLTITATDPQDETSTKRWSLTVPPVSRSFRYDANGNTLSDRLRTMTWDAKNRLKSVTKDGTIWSWDYDYRDRRIRECTNGTLTKVFIWSGSDLIQERDANNVITRTHYTGGFSDGPDSLAGTKYQVLSDHLGNVRQVLKASDGTLAARFDYTPYQGPVKMPLAGENPPGHLVDPTFLTIGRYQHHAGTGLELALYREYDASLGRWLSRDPLRERGGINLYVYVRNSPVVAIVPLGLNPCTVRVNFSIFVWTLTLGVAFDQHGGVEGQISSGPGFTAGASATIGGTLTDADNIAILLEPSAHYGITAGEGAVGEVNLVFGQGYRGVDMGGGVGLGAPISPQFFVTDTDRLCCPWNP